VTPVPIRRAARAACTLLAATAAVASLAAPTREAAAQTWPTTDPVLRRIWTLGMDSSQTYPLMQALTDSIGPRLTGTPGIQRGHDWLVRTYGAWGVPARNERVGTWKGWRRGVTHVDLVSPRVRTLEGTMLAWSPGTGGRDVTAPVVLLPEAADSAAFAAWLPTARGRFVLVSPPHPTCRADESWERWALPATLDRVRAARDSVGDAWAGRVRATGYALSLGHRLARPGARAGRRGRRGRVALRGRWGVRKVFFTRNERAPALDLACEDYALLARLAANGQGPVLRVRADAEALGTVPTFNTVAEVRGAEKPDEYVVLSAHFDSWDAASGATDNGTGTVTMLEAMRLLRLAYPRPKRTILVGHWTSEEQGLNGSRAFVEDRPNVVRGLQALFNQDNGTGRIENVSAAGLVGAGEAWGRWAARVPSDLTSSIKFSFPGSPAAAAATTRRSSAPARRRSTSARGRGTTARTPGTPTATRSTRSASTTCA
jgi:hypothetical protein